MMSMKNIIHIYDKNISVNAELLYLFVNHILPIFRLGGFELCVQVLLMKLRTAIIF